MRGRTQPDAPKPPAAQISNDKRAAEYLANERTFLAWIRTSIAVISFGLVAGKITVIVPSVHRYNSVEAQTARPLVEVSVGVVMMAFGGLLAAVAAWRYHVVNRDIERGEVKADRGLVIFITVLVVIFAAAMIIYSLARPAGA